MRKDVPDTGMEQWNQCVAIAVVMGTNVWGAGHDDEGLDLACACARAALSASSCCLRSAASNRAVIARSSACSFSFSCVSFRTLLARFWRCAVLCAEQRQCNEQRASVAECGRLLLTRVPRRATVARRGSTRRWTSGQGPTEASRGLGFAAMFWTPLSVLWCPQVAGHHAPCEVRRERHDVV